MAYTALMMLRRRQEHSTDLPGAGSLANRLRLHSSYYDESLGREVHYHVWHTPLGFGLMYVAGIISGLLGVGSGALKVPAMDLAMRCRSRCPAPPATS